jgi:hypothetical protein
MGLKTSQIRADVEGMFTSGVSELRVVTTGSREWDDAVFVRDVFNEILGVYPPKSVTVAQGGARGLDKIVERLTIQMGFRPPHTYPVDWKAARQTLGPNWKQAGPSRNERMLEEERPHLVMAFNDFPYLVKPLQMYSGTRGCVDAAVRRGISTFVFRHGKDPYCANLGIQE